MNDPIRLLESSSNPGARDLLQAGLRERPQPSAVRSTALALGVGGSLVAATTSAAASAGASAVVSPTFAPTVTFMIGKWVVLGMAGGVALAGGASILSAPTTQQGIATTAARASSGTRAEPAAAKRASPQSQAEAPVLPRVAPSESTPVPAGVRSPAVAPKARIEAKTPSPPTSASLPNAQSLSREIALIDGSRRALSAGNAAAALAQLNEYATSLRTGTLDREAHLLRIDALLLAGQRAAAVALAERYLASYPNDPHTARLRELSRTP